MRLIVPRPWMQYILVVAGIYNLIFGLCSMIAPEFFFRNLQLALPNYIIMWQGIGLIEIMYGIGYLIASTKPFKHWVIVFIGFCSKFIATFGFIYYYYKGVLPGSLSTMVIANEIIWLLPFGLILYKTFDYIQACYEFEAYDMSPRKLKSLQHIRTNQGQSLQEITDQDPTLLIFLRHFGCTFCKEALWEISEKRSEIEAQGTRIILVHMVEEECAVTKLKQFQLEDLVRISDPDKSIYNSFGLKRGNIFQVYGFNVMLRSFLTWVSRGYVQGRFVGDGFQMPGVFLIHKGMVIQTFKHTTAADRPDYIELARLDTIPHS